MHKNNSEITFIAFLDLFVSEKKPNIIRLIGIIIEENPKKSVK